MPKLRPRPIHNAYKSSINKTKQRYINTTPHDMGDYVLKHGGTLKGSFIMRNGEIIYWIKNLSMPLKEKLKELEDQD